MHAGAVLSADFIALLLLVLLETDQMYDGCGVVANAPAAASTNESRVWEAIQRGHMEHVLRGSGFWVLPVTLRFVRFTDLIGMG